MGTQLITFKGSRVTGSFLSKTPQETAHKDSLPGHLRPLEEFSSLPPPPSGGSSLGPPPPPRCQLTLLLQGPWPHPAPGLALESHFRAY